ncbi:MAG: DUF5663 domain-containing protein [Candidatus Magasanikbacteria bacterium]
MTQIPLTQANIINILGIESLPEEQKIKIVENALELIDTRTITRVVKQLDEEKTEKFADLMEQENIEETQKLLKEEGINLLEITREEVEKLKKEFKSIAETP